jgi:hypothetical protein
MAHERTSIQTALRTDILASVDPDVVAARDIRNDTELARLYNLDSAFIVWRKNIPIMDVGKAVVYTAIDSMSSLNQTRLQLFVQLNEGSFHASADIDTMFQGIFSGALGGGGAPSRTNLAAMLRRASRRAEALLATGAGTTNNPGELVFDGAVSVSDISSALND